MKVNAKLILSILIGLAIQIALNKNCIKKLRWKLST